MKKYFGYSLIAIALLHQVVGLVFYQTALAEILNAGIFNSINPPYWDRDAAFWFLMFGGLFLLLGMLLQWVIEKTGEIPSFLGWGILLISLIGVFLMPASGFWLVIPVALLMLRTEAKPLLSQELESNIAA